MKKYVYSEAKQVANIIHSPGSFEVGRPQITYGAYVRGFEALTVVLVGRLPGVYGPLGRWGINQHGELAVVEQAQRAEQPTAGRDRFPFKVREPCA